MNKLQKTLNGLYLNAKADCMENQSEYLLGRAGAILDTLYPVNRGATVEKVKTAIDEIIEETGTLTDADAKGYLAGLKEVREVLEAFNNP